MATWTPGAGAAVATVYEVTWTRNAELIRTDTVTALNTETEILRAGPGIPDTVLVTLWPLYGGVPSPRAAWRERIYRAAGPLADTIELGAAPPPDPGPGLVAAPAPTPSAAPAQVGAPAAAFPSALPGPPRLVTLRVLDPPAEWAARGLVPECVAGVPEGGPFRLVIVAETAEHCRFYVQGYGGWRGGEP